MQIGEYVSGLEQRSREAGTSLARSGWSFSQVLMRAGAESLSAVRSKTAMASLRTRRIVGQQPQYLLHGAALLGTMSVVAVGVLQPRPELVLSLDGAERGVIAGMAELPMEPDEVVAAAPAATKAQPQPPIRHTVEDGESLRMLSAKFGVSPATILAANDLANPDLIQVGQELVILPTNGVLHRLSPGESLRAVAARYDVELTDIVGANDLQDVPDLVPVGAEIVVPGADPAAVLDRRAVAAGTSSGQRSATVGGVEALGGAGSPTAYRQPVPSARTYEVETGDTLRVIAEKFGVDIPTILSINGIDDPDTIKPGSELRILPVKGLEYTVEPGETLADISRRYQVDLGILLDYNDLDNPDVVRVGAKLVLPGGKLRADARAVVAPAPVVSAPVVRPGGPAAPAAAVAPAPARAAPKPAVVEAPTNVVGRGGAAILANAMKYRGFRYVFGGTSPAGFDCSGFVYYVHQVSGSPVGRGMWQQYNGGPKISLNQLQPGDTVFFANTYMPGLSHDGIYIGGGQFIHASDESTGVTISSMNAAYWSSRYVGASRLWN